jgi:hypothetical protein
LIIANRPHPVEECSATGTKLTFRLELRHDATINRAVAEHCPLSIQRGLKKWAWRNQDKMEASTLHLLTKIF